MTVMMTWRNHDALDVNFGLYYAACTGAGLVLLGMVAALLGVTL